MNLTKIFFIIPLYINYNLHTMSSYTFNVHLTPRIEAKIKAHLITKLAKYESDDIINPTISVKKIIDVDNDENIIINATLTYQNSEKQNKLFSMFIPKELLEEPK